MSDTLALLYPKVNRIEEDAIEKRGMEAHARADHRGCVTIGFIFD